MVEFGSNELDKFFRQGTKESENIVFREDAWEKMDFLLNRQQRRRRIFFWLILFGSALAIFSVITLTGILTKKEAPSTPQSEPASTPLVQQENDLPVQEEEANFSIDPNSEKNTQPGPITQPPARSNEGLYSDNIGEKMDQTGSVPGKQETSTSELLADEPTESVLKERDKQPLPGLEMREHYDFAAISNLDFNAIGTAEQLESTEYLLTLESKRNKDRFTLGIQFSPELTSVGIGDFNKSDYKIGLYATYDVSNRLVALIGLMYTSKKYLAGPGEYEPPYGFWPNGIAPNATNGECEIIEIPVEITYHFHSFDRGSLYLGLGLSNYFILNEVYNYKYDEQVSGVRRYWHTFDNELYWLSFGQIHLGYEARFGRKYALSVGPYFQIPFKGVGYGEVNLYSFGTQIRFNRFF